MNERAAHRMAVRACALAAATAMALATASLAFAQQFPREPVSDLRGVPTRDGGESRQADVARDTETETGLQRRRYTPTSQGALPDDGGDDPLADPTQRATFSDDILAPATPTSAANGRERRAAAGARRESRSQPAGGGVDELTTGTARTGSVDGFEDDRIVRADAENPRDGAIDGRPVTPEENPYAPLGIRAGTFVFTPTLEQGIGWTSNAQSSPGGSQASFSETRLRLNAVSDWSRHQATVTADGLYRKSLSGAPIEDIEGGISGELRLDLADTLTVTATGGYRVRPEATSSPVIITNVAKRPLRQTIDAGLALAKDIGRARVTVSGAAARDMFGPARLDDNSLVSQSDRDATLYTGRVRAGYELSPALRPFVEAEIGRRQYDRTVDSGGYRRSSNRYALRGGIEFDISEKLRGELAAGWLTERPDDPALAPVSGATVSGNLAWSPVRGTTVELNASTDVETTTAAGETGSLLYSGSLALSRELRSNLTGRALVGMDFRDYGGGGNDIVLRGEASLTWWLNRNLGVTGRLRHETQKSTLPGRNYDASSAFLGMTFQR